MQNTKTYIEYFNYYLKEFCNEIIHTFPKYKSNVLDNYRQLLENKDNKNDLYVKVYVNAVNDYYEKIFSMDEKLFNSESALVFLIGVDFRDIWSSDENNDTTKLSIWKYLQLLTLLCRNIMPEHEELMEILNNIGSDNIKAPSKMIRLLDEEDDVKNDDNSTFDLFNSVNQFVKLVNGKKSNSSIINSLKSVIIMVLKQINMPEMVEKVENFDISNILEMVGLTEEELTMEKIQTLLSDPHNIVDIVDKVLAALENSESDNNMILTFLRMIKQMIQTMNTMGTANSESGDDTNSENSNQASGNEFQDLLMNSMQNLMNDGNFAQMAQQMAESMNDSSNPLGMFGNLFNNPNIQNMAKNLAQKNPNLARQATGSSEVKDRLRAKLNKRNNK